MLHIFNKLIQNLTLKFGYNITKIKFDSEALLAFIESLKPISTQHKLIRVGNLNDGGYLIPNDLNGIKYCFSPGVSNVAGFELQLSELGIKSYLADYSVDGPPYLNSNFVFLKKFLGSANTEKNIRLEDWINSVEHVDNEMILQMDIEGAEYEVLLDTPREILKKFRILVIEFHKLNELFKEFSSILIMQIFNKILKYFYVVHIHPNNCCRVHEFKNIKIPELLEFTFIRKDRVSSFEFIHDLPNELDSRNVLDRDDIVLDKIWYGK